MVERTPGKAQRPGGSVTIRKHPLDPPVTHQAEICDCDWEDDGGSVVVTMPDWAEMLSRTNAAAVTSDKVDGAAKFD